MVGPILPHREDVAIFCTSSLSVPSGDENSFVFVQQVLSAVRPLYVFFIHNHLIQKKEKIISASSLEVYGMQSYDH